MTPPSLVQSSTCTHLRGRSRNATTDVAYNVGYGLRFLYDQGGVNPGVLALDIGVPIKRYDYTRPAVSVFLDFIQSFAAF